MFRKVLVANRGEIAVRLIRALRELNIGSVAVYSDADRAALHVRMADEAAHVGPAPSTESYLRIERIIDAAKRHGVDAIHPGYGFLSENADFADACEAARIAFIGPSADAIRRMGSKTSARKMAIAIGAPVVPGTEEPVDDPVRAREVARGIGYPVLLKAAAGGGGKGMRRVDSENELESALLAASSEAGRAFSNSAVYLEKLVERPRHIEIQIIGDRHGNMIHLGERECSIQRRHQKVIEECPSPLVAQHIGMRHAMGEAALKIARAVGYYNAGTMEFLVDAHRNFYFLEMNTRLQVEHPVTELVTATDLVHMQIRIAEGEPLTLRQEDVTWRGSAIECRIYAEDPNNNFLPSPGRMIHVERPTGPGVRLDSGIYPGWEVPMEYDPLLAKLAVWAGSRDLAIARLKRVLGEYYVSGIKTNITFFRQILDDPEFRAGRLHTGFIDEYLREREPHQKQDPEYEAVAALVAAVFSLDEKKGGPAAANGATAASRWVTAGRARSFR
jgi:acetyl-CoA carboxylase biotin carboxylase subunit